MSETAVAVEKGRTPRNTPSYLVSRLSVDVTPLLSLLAGASLTIATISLPEPQQLNNQTNNLTFTEHICVNFFPYIFHIFFVHCRPTTSVLVYFVTVP